LPDEACKKKMHVSSYQTKTRKLWISGGKVKFLEKGSPKIKEHFFRKADGIANTINN